MEHNEAKNEVKRHLWLWNYRLKDVSGLAPYNFIMSNGKRVKVVVAKSEKSLNRFKIRTRNDCDVLVVVVENPGDRPKKFYAAAEVRGPENYLYFDKFNNTPNGVI